MLKGGTSVTGWFICYLLQGGSSEGEKEEAKHAQLEENYSFVWGKNRQTPAHTDNVIEMDSSDTQTQGQTESQRDSNTDIVEDDGS